MRMLTTATRVLDFVNTSWCTTTRGTYPCALIADALSAYYGSSFVRVEGTAVNEHVVVDSVTAA